MKDLKDFFRVFWGEVVLMTILAIITWFVIFKN